MSDGFFLVAHSAQFLAALHQVADNHHTLHGKLPVLVLLLTVLTLAFTIEGSHGNTRE